jgi:hypothetical protein
MSMLTPPGMGGKYRITGTQHPRMRRPRSRGRIISGTVAVAVVVGLLGWGSLQLIAVFGGATSGSPANAAQNSACGGSASPAASSAKSPLVSAALPKPGSVTVNVFNATARSGLAKETADALRARGYKIGTLGNAPAAYDKKVKQAALLLGGTQAQAAIKTVSAELTGATTKIDPKRSGTTVDLMIGNAFTKLSGDAAVKRALAALSPSASATSKSC